MFQSTIMIISAILCSLVLQVSAQNNNVRLVDGSNRCQGRLEILSMNSQDSYGQACNIDFSTSTAQVVCRQLGCNPVGARRVDASKYGFSPAIDLYSGFGISCTGSEASLSACSRSGFNCIDDEVNYAIAVECGATAGGGAGAGADAGSGSTMLQCNTVMLLISLMLAVVIKGYIRVV